MNRTRLILLVYCALIAGSVLIVPWVFTRGAVRYEREFAFLFTDMGRKSIDYGMIVLEIVALSCLAGIAYLLKDFLDRFSSPGQSSVNASSKTPFIQVPVTAEEKKAAKAYWDNYFSASILGGRITFFRALVLLFFVIAILIALGDFSRNTPK